MTDRPDRPAGFFRPVSARTVARSLPPAVLWAYAAALTGALLLGILALLTLLGAGAVWIFRRDTSISGSVAAALGIGLWVAGPLALGSAVGAATYAATEDRSFPRTVLGTAAAVAVGASLLALDMTGSAAAALAFGWGVAIPSDGPSRIAVRSLPLVVVAVAAAGSRYGAISGLAVGELIVAGVLSPVVAALTVWAADLAWAGVRRVTRDRADPPIAGKPIE